MLLGEGGMGRVYLLAHVNSPELRRVLKVIHEAVAKIPEVVDRFLREARAAASLRHRTSSRSATTTAFRRMVSRIW